MFSAGRRISRLCKIKTRRRSWRMKPRRRDKGSDVSCTRQLCFAKRGRKKSRVPLFSRRRARATLLPRDQRSISEPDLTGLMHFFAPSPPPVLSSPINDPAEEFAVKWPACGKTDAPRLRVSIFFLSVENRHPADVISASQKRRTCPIPRSSAVTRL